MHCLFRFAGWQKQVAGYSFNGRIHDNESVTIAMHVEPPYGVLAALGRDDVMAGPQLDEIAAGHQAGIPPEIVEAPAVTRDGRALYFHKLVNGTFEIERATAT